MKKYISFIIAIIIMKLSLFGCANNNEESNQENDNVTQNEGSTISDNDDEDNMDTVEEPQTMGPWEDGTYTATGDPWEYGSEDATVTISGGKIVEVTLRRLDSSGNEVNYDEWTGEEIDGKTYPNLKQYRIDMANEMIREQTYDVDTISGATVSTANWKEAVRRALEKASQ
ncbi:FMN-binding protein [Defluviitalea phaphyphila]|uniref:FMN-binding protein n=1 Tax=Defluviitalea phaphyphila TaxID=1473580 RepID=UPI0007312BDC|nr:FMN-binding protein [Defluviitalea phaphyphila]